jgi:hypothetical protein
MDQRFSCRLSITLELVTSYLNRARFTKAITISTSINALIGPSNSFYQVFFPDALILVELYSFIPGSRRFHTSKQVSIFGLVQSTSSLGAICDLN